MPVANFIVARIKMNVFLETDRLILRNLTLDDLDNLVKLDSDPEVMRFINRNSSLVSRSPYTIKFVIHTIRLR